MGAGWSLASFRQPYGWDSATWLGVSAAPSLLPQSLRRGPAHIVTHSIAGDIWLLPVIGYEIAVPLTSGLAVHMCACFCGVRASREHDRDVGCACIHFW